MQNNNKYHIPNWENFLFHYQNFVFKLHTHKVKTTIGEKKYFIRGCERGIIIRGCVLYPFKKEGESGI